MAEHGSFRAAAAALHLTPSAISHQMRDLQQRLGTPLFVRESRGVRLTPAALSYSERCLEALATLDAATGQICRSDESRSLRITLGPFIASEVVIPALPDFHRQHPTLDIRVETSMRLAKLESDEADVALRFGGQATDQIALEPLMTMVARPVCAPTLAASLPEDPLLAVGQATRLHSSAVPDAWADWGRHAGIAPEALEGGIWFDSYLSLLRACEQGLGVALGLFPAAGAWVDQGRLQPLGTIELPIQQQYNILYRRADTGWQTLRAFLQWLRSLPAFS